MTWTNIVAILDAPALTDLMVNKIPTADIVACNTTPANKKKRKMDQRSPPDNETTATSAENEMTIVSARQAETVVDISSTEVTVTLASTEVYTPSLSENGHLKKR
jgi:hypothetical protein